MNSALVEAARFERDHRAESYGRRLNKGDGDAERMAIDYQAWVAIAEWLETDRFFSFAGGIDPDHAEAPIIRWPELEDAARAALDGLEAKIARLEQESETGPEQLAKFYARKASLIKIHRRVQVRRQSVDELNRKLTERTAA